MPLSLAHFSFIRQLVNMASMESGSTSANSPTVAVAATKEVLARFGEHRVLKFSSGSPAQEISCLKQAFITFSDVLENGVEEKILVVQLKI